MSFDAKDIAVEYHETARNNHLDAMSDATLEVVTYGYLMPSRIKNFY